MSNRTNDEWQRFAVESFCDILSDFSEKKVSEDEKIFQEHQLLAKIEYLWGIPEIEAEAFLIDEFPAYGVEYAEKLFDYLDNRS